MAAERFAWQAQHLVLSKGWDVRPGVALALLRSVQFAWQAQRLVLSSGVALASLGRRSASAICVAGAALGVFEGVGCTPWRRPGVAGSPLSRGSDVRPGVALSEGGVIAVWVAILPTGACIYFSQ